ncbi:MAG: hypothetical protein HY314_05305 [Acidobacteria bacterium]|nr:hypothetical protein [Acidobacteriota bacterium]
MSFNLPDPMRGYADPLIDCRGAGKHLVRQFWSSASRVAILSLLLLLLLAVPVRSQEASPASSDFVQEMVTLTADDGVKVPAILMYPRSGIDIYSPALVHHHGGPGSTPLGTELRFVPERLAPRGCTTLSIKSRHSSGHPWIPFEKATLDIKAAVDFLSNLGIRDIVLTGRSLGSIRVTRYMIDTQDPRIRALIHYAPTRDLSQWMRAGMGEEYYWRTVDRATRAVSEGRGSEEMIDVHYEPPPPSPPGRQFDLVQTAETWLNWWGPAARTRNTVWLSQIKVPMLLLAGDKDVFDDVALDIKAWLDFLEGLGHREVIGEGHSFGGIRLSHYLSKTQDPRLKGLVFLAPTRNASAWLRKGLGAQQYDAFIAGAEKAVREGNGSKHWVHVKFFMPPPAPAGQVPYEFFQYAGSFLSTWGPKANTVHTEKIATIKVPILSLAGSKDIFVDQAYMEKFTKAAGGPAEYIWYGGADGANHGFDGYEDRVASDIVKWIERVFTRTVTER